MNAFADFIVYFYYTESCVLFLDWKLFSHKLKDSLWIVYHVAIAVIWKNA